MTFCIGSGRPENPVMMPAITTSDLDFAGQEGRSIVQRIDQLEVELQRRGKYSNSKFILDQYF